jgi:hypothetical protein
MRTVGQGLRPEAETRRLFLIAGEPWWLIVLATTTLLFYLAMIPTFHAMSSHGASLGSFEDATSAMRSGEIVDEWGRAGRLAAWVQLAIDLPFMISYALLLAGACMFLARRAAQVGWDRLSTFAEIAAWSGPVAAGCDLAQNLSLALILSGHHSQPWPRISANTAIVTRSLFYGVLIFAICGSAATLLWKLRSNAAQD